MSHNNVIFEVSSASQMTNIGGGRDNIHQLKEICAQINVYVSISRTNFVAETFHQNIKFMNIFSIHRFELQVQYLFTNKH